MTEMRDGCASCATVTDFGPPRAAITSASWPRGEIRRKHPAGRANTGFNAVDHGLGRNVAHAGLIVRTAAKLTQVARRTRQIRLEHGVGAAVRPDPQRIGRTENADDRPIERDRKMHWAGIVGDAAGGAMNERGQLAERGLPAK